MENTINKQRRNKSKQDWNNAHYTQIKISVDPTTASAFKQACIDSDVSMAGVLSEFMTNYTKRGAKTKNTDSSSKSTALSTKRQRRNRAKYHIKGLEQIKAAEELSRDNIPPNLQGSALYEKADITISLLDEAIDSIITAFE